MTPDEVAEFITRWEEDLRAQDPVRLAAHYAANVVADSPIAGHLIGRAALEERWRSLFRTFPQAKIERRDLFIRGNDVVWTAAITAIDRAGLFGQSPTGRRVHLSMVFLFALNGQQIVREEVGVRHAQTPSATGQRHRCRQRGANLSSNARKNANGAGVENCRRNSARSTPKRSS